MRGGSCREHRDAASVEALVKFQFQMSATTAGLVGADYFLRYPGFVEQNWELTRESVAYLKTLIV